ncbi:MAG: hypothetical protein ACRENS_13215, partial [Candidatus Eiseniibacteriota bacterium]
MPTPESRLVESLSDAALVAGFEAHTLPLDSWVHLSHLRVAMLYTGRYGFAQGLDRMRAGIQAFNRANGVKDSL